MKKSVNPMSVKELLLLFDEKWFGGTTRVEREAKKAIEKSKEEIVLNQLKRGIGKPLSREECTIVSKVPYFNATIWLCSTVVDGDIHLLVFISKSTPKGIRYYTLNNNKEMVKCSLHFLNRVAERELGNVIGEASMDIKTMYGMCISDFSILVNRDISSTYALLHPYLVVFKEDEECLELVTFLVEPIGAEQTRVYEALMNYKKTTETLK